LRDVGAIFHPNTSAFFDGLILALYHRLLRIYG